MNSSRATLCKYLNTFFAKMKGVMRCEPDAIFTSESTSIPTNPRTTRPVGYAFVDLSTATEAQRAITELSGKEVMNRKVLSPARS